MTGARNFELQTCKCTSELHNVCTMLIKLLLVSVFFNYCCVRQFWIEEGTRIIEIVKILKTILKYLTIFNYFENLL